MSSHRCLICECMAEPPFAFMLDPKPSRVSRSRRCPIVICQDCMRVDSAPRSVDQIEKEILNGTCCHFCFERLSPPGGTTMRTLDGRRLIRVCRSCKAIFESLQV